MPPSIAILTLSVFSAAALATNRFVSTTLGVPAAGAACSGVTRHAVDGAGQLMPLDVLGTVIVETGDAIPAGSAIQCDASGRAIPLGAGQRVARMAPGQAGATAAGQYVEVVLHPN